MSLGSTARLTLLVLAIPVASEAFAQAARRDRIGEMIAQQSPAGQADGATDEAPTAAEPAPAEVPDPRQGEAAYEQARALMQAIDEVLRDTADARGDIKKLPSKNDFVVTPLWTETREDREASVDRLLEAALGIVTDVPVVEIQKRIETHRTAIRDLEDQIVALKEKQLMAPKTGTLPGVITDTVDSLAAGIVELEKRIEANKADIGKAKGEIRTALMKAGVSLEPEQLDLLLDSILSGDLVRLVATFNAAKLIDGQLAKLMSAAGDNTNAARRYFAMHAALFAMLVHAQNSTIAKIDTQYLPKLDAILKDIASAKAKTGALLKADNRPDQQRALEANRDSQKIAEEAAKACRRSLQQQREQIAKARSKATHDLKIADNTYETVEASFQLQTLMREGSASFEALQKLEAPTFDQIFKNEDLRREFESLTRKLDAPTS